MRLLWCQSHTCLEGKGSPENKFLKTILCFFGQKTFWAFPSMEKWFSFAGPGGNEPSSNVKERTNFWIQGNRTLTSTGDVELLCSSPDHYTRKHFLWCNGPVKQ